MPYTFPDEKREEIDVRMGGYGRILITAKDGEITVDDVLKYDDETEYVREIEYVRLNENDQLFWMGAAYWWYRMDGGDYWSCDDWWRAAQCCLILQKVPDCAYLRKVCGISATGEPYDYYQMKRAMDLAEFANQCNTDFREGAD